MLRRALIGILAALAAAPLCAAPLTVRVVDNRGHPVADAVVTLHPAAGARPPHFPGPFVMGQKGMQFHPFVLVVPVGADVSFPFFRRSRFSWLASRKLGSRSALTA